jgi:hypothetical protein
VERAALIDRLLDVGVFAETDDGGLTLAEAFRDDVERRESSLAEDPPTVTAYNDGLSAEPRFADLEDVPASILAIRERLDRDAADLSPDGVRVAVLLVDQLYRGVPRSEGSPEPFFPIRGDQLDACLQLYPASLVYVWLEDCDPCDVMCEDLEEVFPESPDDLGVFSVFGPDASELLEAEFDVHGGPVLLFLLEGSVDTRYIGAYDPVAIEAEVETFREIASSRLEA